MKLRPTDNLETLMKELTKTLDETSPENKETIAYLLGCRDIVDHLVQEKVTFIPRYL